MASLNKAIKNVIEPTQKEAVGMVVAQIIFYDNTTNRADVKYDDPSSGGVVTLTGVQVEIPSLGVASSGPFPGDQVYVCFLNNNPTLPRIIGRADGDYKYYSRKLYEHSRAGSQLSTSYGSVTSSLVDAFTGSSPTPSYLNWISVGSKSTKARNIAINTFSASAFEEQSAEFDNYELAEVGLTHPGTASTMKLYNNGVIDVFAVDDLGMRVDPTLSSLMFNSMDELHNSTNTAFLVGSAFGISSGTYDCTSGSITENSSSHVIASGICAISTAERLSLDGPTVSLTGSNMTIGAWSSLDFKANGATVKLTGDSFTGTFDNMTFSGSTYEANFPDFTIISTNFKVKANKQDEEFGDYNLTADKMKMEAGSFSQKVKSDMKVDVSGAYNLTTKSTRITASDKCSLNAPTLSMLGDKSCKIQYNRINLTTNGEGIILNSAARLNMSAKSGVAVKSEGIFDVNATSSLALNAQGMGTISTNGLEIASAKACKLYTLGGSLALQSSTSTSLKSGSSIGLESSTGMTLKSGSSITATAPTAMTFTAPSITYNASSGLSLNGDITRLNGSQVFLTGDSVNLNGSQVTVSGEFTANIDKLVKDYLTRKKDEVLSTLGLNNIASTASSEAARVFDDKFPKAHQKAHAND